MRGGRAAKVLRARNLFYTAKHEPPEHSCVSTLSFTYRIRVAYTVRQGAACKTIVFLRILFVSQEAPAILYVKKIRVDGICGVPGGGGHQLR